MQPTLAAGDRHLPDASDLLDDDVLDALLAAWAESNVAIYVWRSERFIAAPNQLPLNFVEDGVAVAEVERLLPKSDLAAPLGYLKNHWKALSLHTSEGRLSIDNNETETEQLRSPRAVRNWCLAHTLQFGWLENWNPLAVAGFAEFWAVYFFACPMSP